MKGKWSYNTLSDKILVSSILFLLIFIPHLVSISIIIYLLLLIYRLVLSYKDQQQNMSIKNLTERSKLMILLYLIHCIGLLWTEHLNEGYFDLEVKFSLFIFPLIIGLSNYSSNDISRIFNFSAIAFSTITFILIIRSVYHYFLFHDLLSYNDFVINAHPTYYSMYAVFFISYFLFENNIKYKLYFLSCLIIGIILSSSKAGIISLLLILFFYSYKKNRKYTLLIMLCTIGILYYILHKTNYLIFLSDRIRTTEEIISSYIKNKPLPIESNSIRLYAWKASIHTIKNNLLIGVGTGDTHQALNRYYLSNNLDIMAKKRINAHNTFFQITLSIGIIGLLLFILLLYSFIKTSYHKNKPFIYVFMFMLICCYFTTESVLETQAGTIFLGLYLSLSDNYLKQCT